MIFAGPGGGLGFAVPINVARDVAQQLLDTGRVQRARLGVSYGDVDADLASAYRLPVDRGVVVSATTPRSPAARAGIRPEDIITRVDNAAVRNGGDLRRALRTRRPGETVALTVRRGERTLTVTARLADAADLADREE
jgi:serine protease Do